VVEGETQAEAEVEGGGGGGSEGGGQGGGREGGGGGRRQRAGAEFLTMINMGANPTSDPTLTNPTQNLGYLSLFWGGGVWVGFKVGLGVGRIGIILQSFLVIPTQILPRSYHDSYRKDVEIKGLLLTATDNSIAKASNGGRK
jgi:hypothetical protein